jgi:shikimate kinase
VDFESQNLYLIGLMGAGKTTIGRLLARHFGRPFFDSDHEIEARTGVKVPVIFEIEGEAGFRQRESQVIAELTQRSGIVLATGGGAVLDPANRAALRSTGYVIYLRAQPPDLWQRTQQDRNRPLLRTADPEARLRQLHEDRDPLYRETAHLIMDTGRQSPHLLAGKLEQQIRNTWMNCA